MPGVPRRCRDGWIRPRQGHVPDDQGHALAARRFAQHGERHRHRHQRRRSQISRTAPPATWAARSRVPAETETPVAGSIRRISADDVPALVNPPTIRRPAPLREGNRPAPFARATAGEIGRCNRNSMALKVVDVQLGGAAAVATTDAVPVPYCRGMVRYEFPRCPTPARLCSHSVKQAEQQTMATHV